MICPKCNDNNILFMPTAVKCFKCGWIWVPKSDKSSEEAYNVFNKIKGEEK